MKGRLIKCDVIAGLGRFSARLEPEIWDGLLEICEREKINIHDLVSRMEEGVIRAERTSAIRILTFNYFRAAATTSGHTLAGHGSQLLKLSPAARIRRLVER